MQHHKLTTDNNRFPRISADVYGTAGPALMLIHGFPANARLWREVAPALSRHFMVIVPDMPGVGDSILSGGEVSIEQLAEAMVALLDQAGVGKAMIAGHSMGGYVALAIAENHADRLAGLSLVHSTAYPDDEEKIATRKNAMALIEKGGREAFIRSNVASLFAPGFKDEHAQVIERQTADGLEVPEQTLLSFYNAMINRPDRTKVLETAAFPVQWIIGEEDKVVPKEKSLQQSSLSLVSFVSVYNNCGHMSMLEQPEALLKDIGMFADYCYHGKQKD